MSRHVWTGIEDALLLKMHDEETPWSKRAEALNLRIGQIKSRTERLRGVVKDAPNVVYREDEDEDDVQIPIHVECGESPHASKTCGDENPRERVEKAAAQVASAADADKSTRAEWSVASAGRERTLLQKLAEHKRRETKLLDEIQTRDEWLNVASALASAPPIVGKPRAPGSRRHGVPVIVLSDWHVEEPVHPEQVNGLNEYNLAIAEECIERCADAYEWMLRDSRYDCREGVVALIGDLFSGHIHDELVENNQLSPVEVMVWLFARIVRMFDRILAETKLERIVVICNDGNHGRLTHRMRIATRTKNSLEWLLYQQLARHFAKEPRLQFQIAAGISNYLDVYGTSFCFQHGDTYNYQGGVGGLLIPVRRGFNELRKYRKVDHLVIGHFHQRLPGPDIIVNGSMIGINPYSMSIKATPEPRRQSWFMVDQDRGMCLDAPVWLPDTSHVPIETAVSA